MKPKDLLQRRQVLGLRLQRAYRRSEIRKLLLWLKGKTLSPVHYIVLASLLIGGSQGIQYYRDGLVDVVFINGCEIGMVEDAAAVEQFMGDLVEKCSLLYGVEVFPREEITYNREFHPRCEPDFPQVADTLRQRINLLTEAVMVNVDGWPSLPVAAEEEIDKLTTLLCSMHANPDDRVTLLETALLEEVSGHGCVVSPDQVYPAERVAAVLTRQGRPTAQSDSPRDLLASRAGRNEGENWDEIVQEMPLVHVKIVEEAIVEEKVPFDTTYKDNNSMWSGESRVVTAGVEGLKKVTYRITRVNDEETSKEAISEELLKEPVSCVVERGTVARFTWPVAGGGTITQYFKGRAHNGIDIAAAMGTSVLAAESGVVARSAWGGSQGNYIVICHGNYWTLYLHNSANLVYVGQQVSRGQTIARLGSTGHSTGPHLHFEIRRSNGSGVWTGWYDHPAVDPLSYFR